MKHDYSIPNMAIEEIEKLCQLYLDCQLTVLEEKELELLLLKSHFDSPVINETRDLMMVSYKLKLDESSKQSKPFNRKYFTIGGRIAACVAISIGIFMFLLKSKHSSSTGNYECVAYVSGTKVSDEDAKKIVHANAMKVEKFMSFMDEQEAREELKVKQYMDKIK